MDEARIQALVEDLKKSFRIFGGQERVTDGNPLAAALANNPATFAAGVSVEQVVRHILEKAEQK